jgi:nucleoside-diphosphate-sugar epimerase
MTESARAYTILVTGGGGFIGGAMLRAATARGWRAIGCGRNRPADFDGAEWRAYDLTATNLDDTLFAGVDVLVHAAYVKRDYARNVAGSRLLFERAQSCGVPQLVFLSSLAAQPDALSTYGKQKYELERTFEASSALCVRPGLVIGSGGLFASMREYLRDRSIIPLIGGGAQPLQTVSIDDLTDAICAGIERKAIGTFTVAEREPVAYRDFYAALAACMDRQLRFVPIPFWSADLAVRIAGTLGVRLPIDRDNLLGLRAMRRDSGPWLDPPGRRVNDYRENLRRAFQKTASVSS